MIHVLDRDLLTQIVGKFTEKLLFSLEQSLNGQKSITNGVRRDLEVSKVKEWKRRNLKNLKFVLDIRIIIAIRGTANTY